MSDRNSLDFSDPNRIDPLQPVDDRRDSGILLRDWFAGQAMQAVADRWKGTIGDIDREAIHRSANISYAFADAMLEARDRK